MSSDPSSGGPRNYYEDQFGARIRDISKVGSAPQPATEVTSPGNGSSPGGSGKGIGGGLILVVVVCSLLRALSSSGSRPTAPPPTVRNIPIPRFDVPVMDPELPAQLEEMNRLIRELNEHNKQPLELDENVKRLLKEIEEESRKADPDRRPDPRNVFPDREPDNHPRKDSDQ